MKHFISFSAVIVSVLLLCSCNNETSSVSTDITHNWTSASETSTTASVPSAAQSTNIQTSLEIPTEPTSVKIDETLLIDESGIKITAKRLDFSKSSGPALFVLIENNSGGDITVQCRNSSVNGYMIDTIMSENVSNGKKANASITFKKGDLDTCNISTIADIEFNFTAFSSDTDERYLENTKINLKTSAASSYEYKFDDSGDLIYDENNIRIIAKGIASKNLRTCIVVYIENNTDTDWTVQVRDTSVNGFMINPVFSPVVSGGKRLIGFISFHDSELAENDIDEINEVETSFIFFENGNNSLRFNTDILKIKI